MCIICKQMSVVRKKTCCTNIEWIMFIIIYLMFIRGILVASLQDLPGLLSHIWLGTELQQPPSKTSSSFLIFQLKEEVEGSSEGENLMDWLEVAVGEIGGHFTNTNLFLDIGLG